MTNVTTSAALHQAAPGHAAFCECVLPAVERHARFAFRHLRCADSREDAVQETVALCWAWFLSLAERGKDATAFPTALAAFAARAVRSGRRVCGHDRKKEALSPVAQRLHGFAVGKLPDYSTLDGNPLEEALQENTVSPVPEQAAFKIDFPAWRLTQCERDRRLIDRLMLGERTRDVSRTFGLSPGRISQKRRAFHEDWRRFHHEADGEGRLP